MIVRRLAGLGLFGLFIAAVLFFFRPQPEHEREIYADIHFCWSALRMMTAEEFLVPAAGRYLESVDGVTEFDVDSLTFGPEREFIPWGGLTQDLYALETTDGDRVEMTIRLSDMDAPRRQSVVMVTAWGPEDASGPVWRDFFFDVCGEPRHFGG